MGGDIIHRRPPYISACVSLSCAPVHEEEYPRIRTTPDKCHNLNRRLWKLLRKIGIYGNRKPITFQYDAVSYSQNFDDGCRRDDECMRC